MSCRAILELEMFESEDCSTGKLSFNSGDVYSQGYVSPLGAFDGSSGMSRAYLEGCNANTIAQGATLLGWTFDAPVAVRCVKLSMFSTDMSEGDQYTLVATNNI